MLKPWLFRDENDAGGDGNYPEETIEEEVTNEPSDDSEDESQEESEEEVASDDSEGQEQDEDVSEFDEGSYLRQYENIPEEIGSVDDAMAKLNDVLGGLPGFKRAQTESAQLAEVDAALKRLGIPGGYRDVLEGRFQQPQTQQYQQPAQWTTAEQLLNNELQSGRLDEFQYNTMRPLAKQMDTLAEALASGYVELQRKVDGLSGINQKLIGSQRESEYKKHVDILKGNGLEALSKEDLDKVIDKYPDFGYMQAQMHLWSADPNKVAKSLRKMQRDAKKAGEKMKFRRGVQPKGRADSPKVSYEDYLDKAGEPNTDFDKLPEKEQNRLLDEFINKHR